MLKELPQEMKITDRILAKDYLLLSDLALPLKDKWEKNIVPAFVFYLHRNGHHTAQLAAACQCFYLFFRFHSLDDGETRKNILLGDYFFSRFLELLVLSGNNHLLPRFCQFVMTKCQQPPAKSFSLGELLPFISLICKESLKGNEKKDQSPHRMPTEEGFPLRQAKPVI